MWIWRKMEKISWTDQETNEAGAKTTLFETRHQETSHQLDMTCPTTRLSAKDCTRIANRRKTTTWKAKDEDASRQFDKKMSYQGLKSWTERINNNNNVFWCSALHSSTRQLLLINWTYLRQSTRRRYLLRPNRTWKKNSNKLVISAANATNQNAHGLCIIYRTIILA